jgi:hypothetical protein
MFFGRIVSLVMAHVAVVGLFVEIPIVSNYTFWVMVGTWFLWLAVHRFRRRRPRFQPLLMASIVLTVAAIVAVFVEIPIVSNYAFWVMAANYLITVAGTHTHIRIVIE